MTWMILALLIAVALAAPRYGVDTRTADGWRAGSGPRARADVWADVAAVSRAVTGRLRR